MKFEGRKSYQRSECNQSAAHFTPSPPLSNAFPLDSWSSPVELPPTSHPLVSGYLIISTSNSCQRSPPTRYHATHVSYKPNHLLLDVLFFRWGEHIHSSQWLAVFFPVNCAFSLSLIFLFPLLFFFLFLCYPGVLEQTKPQRVFFPLNIYNLSPHQATLAVSHSARGIVCSPAAAVAVTLVDS